MPKGNFRLLLYPFFNEKNNQYINPIIDAKNIDSNILIGPSHNPKSKINKRSPYPIGCFLEKSHVPRKIKER